MVPAFGALVAGHFGQEKHGLSVVAPRAAEGGFCLGGFAGDVAVREDGAVGREVWGRGGREIAAQKGVDRAAVEGGGGPAEKEIGRSGDRTVFDGVTAAVDEERVLIAEQTAAAKNGAVAVDADREGLALRRAGGVGEGEILQREVVGVEAHGGRTEGGGRFPVGSGIVVAELEGQDRFLRGLTDERDEAFLPLDVHNLAIRAGLDEEGPTARAGGRETNSPSVSDCCLFRPARWVGNPVTGRAYSQKTTGCWYELGRGVDAGAAGQKKARRMSGLAGLARGARRQSAGRSEAAPYFRIMSFTVLPAGIIGSTCSV